METENLAARPSKAMTIAGWIIGVLPCLLLIFSGAMKFMPVPPESAAMFEHIGWRPEQMSTLGVLELACVIIYLFPRTAVLGAILLTGYMGGAIATHVRVGDPVYLHIVIGIAFWLGLWLREPRLRQILPLR